VGLSVKIRRAAVVFLAVLAACVKYQPKPLDPPTIETAYHARTLDNPGIHSFVEANLAGELSEWPSQDLDLNKATLIAWYFHPELDVARAAVRTAEAGVIAAGGRINPSVSIASGYSTAPESASLFDFLPSFTIETAGKRGFRSLVAQERTKVARLRVQEVAWLVRSRVRSALLEQIIAGRRRDLIEQEVAIRAEVAAMLERRLEVGETARPVVDFARQELAAAQAVLAGAIGQQEQTRAALAASLGLSSAALIRTRFRESAFDTPPPETELSLETVQRSGLLHRTDILRSLAEYAAAEATVRLEVARQYPNLQLDPGFVFEEGFARYIFGFTSVAPLLNRNRGPIAVAEAQRLESEEQFKLLLSQAVAQMEEALAAYTAARQELAEADNRLAAAERVEKAAQRSFELGETDRLSLAVERLLRVTAAQARSDVLFRAQKALGLLENAVQLPLQSAPPFPSAPPERSGGPPK
jgi:outer membrane protein TolC